MSLKISFVLAGLEVSEIPMELSILWSRSRKWACFSHVLDVLETEG